VRRRWVAGLVPVALVAALPQTTHAQAAAPAVPAWKLTGTVDFGFVSATGNTDVTTISLGDKMVASRGPWTLTQVFAQVYGKTSGVESANQLRANIRAERTLVDGIGGFAAVQYERNAFAGFNRRTDQFLGLRWRAIEDSSDALTFDGGGVLTQQENTDGARKSTRSARGAVAYKHIFKPGTFFAQGVEYVPDLEEPGVYRLNSETAAVAPLSSRISMKIGYVFQFNSRPPTGFGTTDRVFTSGLQVSF
jgi:putative salt-induced outer membrane protein